MTTTYKESCSLTRRSKPKKIPWWTKELTNLKREAANKQLIYGRFNTEGNKLQEKQSTNTGMNKGKQEENHGESTVMKWKITTQHQKYKI